MANGNFAGGDGTANNPYLIEDAHDLNAVRNGLDKHYKLIKDIDLDVPPYNEGEGWIPIEDFNGVVNGNGKTVNNLFIKATTYNSGLFGTISEGRVTSLGLNNVIVYGSNKNDTTLVSTGGLAGRIISSTVNGCYCVGVINGGKSTQRSDTGGLIGYSISNDSVVINCYFCGEVRGSEGRPNYIALGGLIGEGDTSHLANCYFQGKLIKRGEANYRTDINGIIGTGLSSPSYINNCFYNEDCGDVTIRKGRYYGSPVSTQQMQTAQTFIDAGWDKETLEDGTPVWILKDGQYPKLWFEKEPYKVLLKQNNEYYTIKPEYYQNGQFQPLTLEGGEQPNENDYENFGFDDVNDLLISQNTKTVQGVDKGGLGEGKYFEVELDNEIKKVNNIELK